MDDNQRFLHKNFRRYYKENRPIMPDRFTRREFGFMFYDKTFVQRHMSFKTPANLYSFMQNQVPAHSYYSTSYYRTPDAPLMDDKGWMGAELIFDLDADHLEGANEMTYAEMLLQIRGEMETLVDRFLLGNLGFSEEQVHITFSGGRGYHAHVRTPDVMGLGTHERRELVDYITCSGLDMEWVFPRNKVPVSQQNVGNATRVNVTNDRLLPPKDSGGWRGMMRASLEEVIQNIIDLEPKDLKKLYPSIKGSAGKSILETAEILRKNRNAIFERDTMAMLPSTKQEFLMKIMTEDIAPSLAGEVDEPVTADIKRLIRLPGSVHGKSGLRVTPITRDELSDFDPLQMAVPETYTDDPVKITMRKPAELDMLGQHFKLEGETEVPEFVAMFLIGRKMADIGHFSEPKKELKDFWGQ